MKDEIGPIGDNAEKKGLIADVRPGGIDVVGQQRELFPFDAFKYESSNNGDDDVITLGDDWKLDGGVLKPDSILTNAIAANAITAVEIDLDSLFAENITLSSTGSIQS